MTLPITALYAGLLGLIYLGLSINISRQRQRNQVGIGHGEVPALERAIRVHGNFSEYVPLVLLLIGLAELNGGPAWGLHGLGVALLLGRVLHAVGLSGSAGVSLPRLALLVGALLCLYQALGQGTVAG